MKEFIWFIVVFLIVYLCYFILILNNKKALEKYKKSKEVTYLVQMYHIDLNKISFKGLANKMFLINSFLISFTISIIVNITEKLIFMVFLAFGILVPLIYLSYFILGKYYQRKEK